MRRGISIGSVILLALAIIVCIGSFGWSVKRRSYLKELSIQKAEESIANMLVIENGREKGIKSGLTEVNIDETLDKVIAKISSEESKSHFTKKLDAIREILIQREFLLYYLDDNYYVGKTKETVKDIQKSDLEKLEKELTEVVKEAGLNTQMGTSLNQYISDAIKKYDLSHNEKGKLKKEALSKVIQEEKQEETSESNE